MFVIDHFEDASKWTEATAGTGAIQNRTVDSFEAVLLASGDRAALMTPVRYNVSELADLRVRATRHCAVSGIALHPTEPDDPSRLGGTIAIWRDVAYGLIVWFGAAVITDDPVPADEPAEMRITLERLATGGVQISFYYNGELLYEDTLSTWMGEDFYVQLGVFADRAGRVVTGTTQFTSAAESPPPPAKYALTVDSAPIRGIPFTIEKVGS